MSGRPGSSDAHGGAACKAGKAQLTLELLHCLAAQNVPLLTEHISHMQVAGLDHLV